MRGIRPWPQRPRRPHLRSLRRARRSSKTTGRLVAAGYAGIFLSVITGRIPSNDLHPHPHRERRIVSNSDIGGQTHERKTGITNMIARPEIACHVAVEDLPCACNRAFSSKLVGSLRLVGSGRGAATLLFFLADRL
jgi:hypothetical protein